MRKYPRRQRCTWACFSRMPRSRAIPRWCSRGVGCSSKGERVLWVKAFHVIFMVTWFAGLFYLPRLFVYHAMSHDAISRERFVIMERKLLWGIMTPGATITILLGLWMLVAGRSVY